MPADGPMEWTSLHFISVCLGHEHAVLLVGEAGRTDDRSIREGEGGLGGLG